MLKVICVAQNIKNKLTGKEKVEGGGEANLKFTANIGSEDKNGESRFELAFGYKKNIEKVLDGSDTEDSETEVKTSKN